ncbi:MAG: diguanylate cyclase [Deltaproteobacteria bacterium]|nr:diguanylate cyclase [Deltaproteobacteria bacterium]
MSLIDRSQDDGMEQSFEDGEYTEHTAAMGFIPLELMDPQKRTGAFIVMSGRSLGKSFTLDAEETLIGRAPECVIQLDDDGVSRRHAKVVKTEDKWVLMDVGSTNGCYHNGERIQVVTLYDGAKVQIGMNTLLRFELQDPMDRRFQQSLYESKTRDALTEAYNKGFFAEAIEKEIAFALRHKQTLSLIMFDIDFFKKVNDTYGHIAGDHVLKSVARSVHGVIRKEDIFARYGGEEFALLLRNTEPEKAFILAERVRRTIEQLEIVHAGRRIPVTVSLGLSSTLGEDRNTSRELIGAADELLYQAKGRGRNRTESPIFES